MAEPEAGHFYKIVNRRAAKDRIEAVALKIVRTLLEATLIHQRLRIKKTIIWLLIVTNLLKAKNRPMVRAHQHLKTQILPQGRRIRHL